MRWPAQALARQNPDWLVVNLDFRSQDRIEWALAADLLVLLHCGDVEFFPVIEKRKALGKKTIIEMNDNFYEPQAWNPARFHWDSPLVWARYEKLIDMADGVLVSGPGLMQLHSKRAQGKLFELPNHLPKIEENFENLWDKKARSEVVIGWGGSAGHMVDLIWVVPVLKKLLAEFPNLKIKLMGDVSTPSFVGLPPDRLKFEPWGSMQNYFEFWKEVHIGIAPMLENPYNNCRSDIKAIEIAGSASATIISNLLPYRELINNRGFSGFKTLKEFETKLRKLLTNREEMQP
jgi:hypothetical protein